MFFQIDEERELKEDLKRLEAKKKAREQSARQLQSYMDSFKDPEPTFVSPKFVHLFPVSQNSVAVQPT